MLGLQKVESIDMTIIEDEEGGDKPSRKKDGKSFDEDEDSFSLDLDFDPLAQPISPATTTTTAPLSSSSSPPPSVSSSPP